MCNAPSRPKESCSSRCNHECDGLNVASCILHCSTPGCHPACCGDCPSDDCYGPYAGLEVDHISYWLGAGETIASMKRARVAVKAFLDGTAALDQMG